MKNQKMYEADDKMISIIRDNYNILQSLGSFGINLGFGDKTVKEVCEEQNVDTYTFLSVVNFTINGYKEYDNASRLSLPIEDTIEQNDNNFDGIINNTPSVDELEKKAKSGEQISLTDLADAIKAEKTYGKGKEEKPSIRAQLKVDKKKAQKKTTKQKSHDLERN